MGISPVLVAIPRAATAVPLILIGAFMMAPCAGIDWNNLRVAIPSFVTVTVVPFTYSIHNGIIAGVLVDLFLGCLCNAHSPESIELDVSSPYSHSSQSANDDSRVEAARK